MTNRLGPEALSLEQTPPADYSPAVKKPPFASWRASFLTGLAVVLPGAISIAVIIWLFGTIANFTDLLLFFVPRRITHHAGGSGPMYWYWSVIAFLLAMILIATIGRLARNYVGKKLIEWADGILLRVPLLNKIYGAIKQVNEAFTTGKKTAFKTVVLIQFPRLGLYSIGFITSEQHAEVQAKTKEKVVCVFVPTTPNPTSGFFLMVPRERAIVLDMSVEAGLKMLLSVGVVAPGNGKSTTPAA